LIADPPEAAAPLADAEVPVDAELDPAALELELELQAARADTAATAAKPRTAGPRTEVNGALL
jgi:hypothetical protein